MARKKKTRSKRQTDSDSANTRWISFRWPVGLVEQLDKFVIAERKRTGFEINRTQLLACYRSCEIALITPLRDGMNLVAKEY